MQINKTTVSLVDRSVKHKGRSRFYHLYFLLGMQSMSKLGVLIEGISTGFKSHTQLKVQLQDTMLIKDIHCVAIGAQPHVYIIQKYMDLATRGHILQSGAAGMCFSIAIGF